LLYPTASHVLARGLVTLPLARTALRRLASSLFPLYAVSLDFHDSFPSQICIVTAVLRCVVHACVQAASFLSNGFRPVRTLHRGFSATRPQCRNLSSGGVLTSFARTALCRLASALFPLSVVSSACPLHFPSQIRCVLPFFRFIVHERFQAATFLSNGFRPVQILHSGLCTTRPQCRYICTVVSVPLGLSAGTLAQWSQHHSASAPVPLRGGLSTTRPQRRELPVHRPGGWPVHLPTAESVIWFLH
jgi:hypothetical protein